MELWLPCGRPIASISSSCGDGNIGNPDLRLPELSGVLGVNMILGNGVFGEEVDILLGDANVIGLTLGEENADETLRSISSLLILLFEDFIPGLCLRGE